MTEASANTQKVSVEAVSAGQMLHGRGGQRHTLTTHRMGLQAVRILALKLLVLALEHCLAHSNVLLAERQFVAVPLSFARARRRFLVGVSLHATAGTPLRIAALDLLEAAVLIVDPLHVRENVRTASLWLADTE